MAPSPAAHIYQQIKTQISLPAFATERLGWQVVREKSTSKMLVLKHALHGKILAPTTPADPSGIWYYYTPGVFVKKQGTLIDLLQKHDWSWAAIEGLASGYEATPLEPRFQAPSSPADPHEHTRLAQAALRKIGGHPLQKSYLSERGLLPSIYQGYPQLKASPYQAVFSLYKDFSEHPLGRLCSTLSYYRSGDKSEKYFQKGLPRGLAVLSDPSPSPSLSFDRLFVTESPIDALSYKQLASQAKGASPSRTLYVATCGTLSKALCQDLSYLFQSARRQGSLVVLGFDNDAAGKAMTSEVSGLLHQTQTAFECQVPPGGHKDWNEALLSKSQHQSQQQAQAHMDSFPALPYNETLLKHLGYPPSACYGLLANERSIMWGLYQAPATPSCQLVSTYTLQKQSSGVLQGYYQKGLPRGLAVLKSAEAPRQVVITEDPLLALQERRRLYEGSLRDPGQGGAAYDTTLFVSTCTAPSSGVYQGLRDLLKVADQQALSVKVLFPEALQASAARALSGSGPYSYECAGPLHLPEGLKAAARQAPVSYASDRPRRRLAS